MRKGDQSVVNPFIRTHEETELYNDLTALSILPFTTTRIRFCQSKLRSMESYAFLKSINAVYVLSLHLMRVSIKFVRLLTWSIVLRPVLKPFCSSTNVLSRQKHLSSLSFKIEQYNLHVAGANVIPL